MSIINHCSLPSLLMYYDGTTLKGEPFLRYVKFCSILSGLCVIFKLTTRGSVEAAIKKTASCQVATKVEVA